jgi:hypothetical protein
MRWDETWHRLVEWTNGQAPSERLAGQVLLSEGYRELDPSHPLGGKDAGKDALCIRNGELWAMAVYFPRGQQAFTATEAKFRSDLDRARTNDVVGFVFVTNQELRLSERHKLSELWLKHIEIYHLERITAILDEPKMHSIRKQFLDIDPDSHPDGVGGAGGTGTVLGNRATVIGGRGGAGGVSGVGGAGGGGFVVGDDATIIGGDGGSAATADGRGGRGAVGPLERAEGPTELWPFGRGGQAANHPEYDRRLGVLKDVRSEYSQAFPERLCFIEAGVESVPISWVNKRLEERGESWRIHAGPNGYVMPPLSGLSDGHVGA